MARGAFGQFSFYGSFLKDGSLDGLWPGMLLERVLFITHVLDGLWPGVPLDGSPFIASFSKMAFWMVCGQGCVWTVLLS